MKRASRQARREALYVRVYRGPRLADDNLGGAVAYGYHVDSGCDGEGAFSLGLDVEFLAVATDVVAYDGEVGGLKLSL